MKAHNKSPVFSENAKASATADENGKEIYKTDIVAPYYIVDDENTDGFTVGKDVLEKGKTYTITVTAESTYKLKSEPVAITFKV